MATSQNSVNGSDRQETGGVDRRDSREIKRRINRTRTAMDDTLDELGERLHPRHLIDDVISIFRQPSSRDTAKRAGDAATDFVGTFGRQVRDNPIGATLVGAGLAWLVIGGRRDEQTDGLEPIARRRALQNDYIVDASEVDEFEGEPAYYTENDLLLDQSYDSEVQEAPIAKSAATAVASSIADSASSTGEAIGDAASAVVDGVKSATSSVADKLSSVGAATSDASRTAYSRSRAGDRMSSRVSAGSHQLTEAYEAISRRTRRAHEETPLAIGLGVMALGAIAGALIPRTRREDEAMGEASDEVVRQARDQAKQVYARGQEAVENTMETAKQSAESQGLTKDGLAERATTVVEQASSSISQATADAKGEVAKKDPDVKSALEKS